MAKKGIPKLRNKIATSGHILSLYPIHKTVEILGRNCYDAIEVWAEELERQIKRRETSIQKIKSALKKSGMVGVIHAPLHDLTHEFKEKYNICSKDRKLRKKSIHESLWALDIAHKLGFHVVTIHPGHTDSKEDVADKEYWRLLIDAFKQLAKRAEKLDVKIGVEPMENIPKEFVIAPKHLDRIISSVDSKNLGVTFDLVHTYTHGEKKPVEFIDQLHKEKIFHVHISGHTKEKTHVPFFMTRIHHRYFDKVIGMLVKNYSGIISIEGTIKGIMPLTKTNQKFVVKKNMEYIHKELKSLHFI